MYKIFFHPKAREAFEKIEHSVRKGIKDKILELKQYPEERGKHLKYSSFWRIRVGSYRVIYEVDNKKERVIVLFIGHRESVYDDFSKLF